MDRSTSFPTTALPTIIETLRKLPAKTLVRPGTGEPFYINGEIAGIRASGTGAKRLFEDKEFKEGITGVINFPTEDETTVRAFTNFLQFDEWPELPAAELVKLYAMADEYQVNELMNIITGKLLEIAKDPEMAPTVYELCRGIPRSDIICRTAATTVYRYLGKRELVLTCIDCEVIPMAHVCRHCAKLLHGSAKATCQDGHEVDPNALDCDDPWHLVNEDKCNGHVVKTVRKLNFNGVSDNTIAELMKKIHA